MDSSAPPLCASHVNYTYPSAEAPALCDVSVTVAAGEYVALLGPNGAGKTTLINLVTGLQVADHGTVRVAGGDPTRADTRLSLGVVLQDTAFPPHLRVDELVVGAAVRSGRPAATAGPVLDEVDLGELGNRRSKHLSGGQRRRLQLARALVTDPALLVLDEPTEGLDAVGRQTFWRNLAARRDAGMAVLLTTHLIEEAGVVADRVTVLADGRVVADEDPVSLSRRLPDRSVTLRTAVPLHQIRALDGVITAEHQAASANVPSHAVPRDSPLTRIITEMPEQVLRTLLAADPAVTDLRVEGASLEEAVMAVSGLTTPTRPTVATATPN